MPRTSPVKKNDSVYIFLGPELGKKQAAIDAIRKKISEKASYDETILYAGETDVRQIIFEIQNQNLFVQSKLFIIKNAELIKKKNEIDTLMSCLCELEKGTTVILISEEIKLAAGMDDIVPKENYCIYYELFEREKNEWVRNYFRQQGFIIDAEGIDTVLELVENNTEALARECSRLMFFLHDSQKSGQSRTVSTEDAEQWLSHNREESAFTLFSRIAAGDFPKAMESLRSIIAEKKFQDKTIQMMLAGIVSCFRKLRAYHTLMQSGQADNSELKKIGISFPRARDEYAAAARRFNANATDACIALTAEYDLLIRTMGGAFELILIDLWLLKIFRKKQK